LTPNLTSRLLRDGPELGARVVERVAQWLGLRARLREDGIPVIYPEAPGMPGSASGVTPARSARRRAVRITFAEVVPQRLHWLWRGRIPLGAITLLQGDPGLGKSLLTIDLIARLTTGRPMPASPETPEEGPALEGSVVLVAEDDRAMTILPRLLAAGADVGRVSTFPLVTEVTTDPVTGLAVEQEVADGILLPEDTDLLEAPDVAPPVRLYVIDPVNSFLGQNVDSYKDQSVRAAFRPLVRLATRTGAAVLLLRHLNKTPSANPLYRGNGSIALMGLARSGLIVAPDLEDPDHQRILASSKSNLGPPMPSLRYALRLEEGREHPRVAWLGQSPLNATALLASGMASDPANGAPRPAPTAAATAVGRAGIWLRAALSAGPRPVLDVFGEAEEEGISEAALHRAFAQGGFMRARRGAGKGSATVWGLVEAAAAEDRAARGVAVREPGVPGASGG
jgi:putative DNA primase/helicase